MLSERVDSAQLMELASKGATQALSLSVPDLARLSACTYYNGSGQDIGEPAELTADVQFEIGAEDFPRIGLSISGCLSLKCQRCLEPLTWPVRIETCLTVLDSDAQTDLIASPFDSVLISADGLDIVAVIEDEILATLPMVPVHNDGSQCRPSGGEDNNLLPETELTKRPFADLASLMGSRKSSTDD